jgi:hypothetical protein
MSKPVPPPPPTRRNVFSPTDRDPKVTRTRTAYTVDRTSRPGVVTRSHTEGKLTRRELERMMKYRG